MNDDFEQKLRRQRLRSVPPEWREKILSHAHDACHVSRITQRSFLSTLKHHLLTCLWPHRQAWAGLAAVWVVILALNFAAQDRAPAAMSLAMTPPSRETLQLLKQQERLLAELSERTQPREAGQPKTVPPQPRSQRREENADCLKLI